MIDDENMNQARTFLDSGQYAVRLMEAGPALWVFLGSAEIQEDHVADYLGFVMSDEECMNQSFISGKRRLLHKYVDALADAFESWARDFDRPDLLATVSERLNRAVKP